MTYREFQRQTPVYKASLIVRRIAERLAVIIVIVAILVGCYKLMAWAQNTPYECSVVSVTENEVEFERPNGHTYIWETSKAKEIYTIGDMWTVYFFDLENGNPKDDIITAVGTKQN